MTTTDLVVQHVPIVLIDDPLFNSRIRADGVKLKRFAEVIDAEGLKHPIELEAYSPPGENGETDPAMRYRVVAGSRRLAAHKILQRETIPAVIKPSMTEVAGVFSGIIENMQREQLTTYEQARSFDKLRQLGIKQEEIADRVGVTKGYVSNLVVMYNVLAPQIRFHWEKSEATFDHDKGMPGTSEGLVWYPVPINKLRAIASIRPKTQKPEDVSVAHTEQLVRFKKTLAEISAQYKGENGQPGPKKNKRGTGGGTAGFSLIQRNMKIWLDLVKSKDAPKLFGGDARAKFLRQLTDWLIGQRKTVPEGFPATEETEGKGE